MIINFFILPFLFYIYIAILDNPNYSGQFTFPISLGYSNSTAFHSSEKNYSNFHFTRIQARIYHEFRPYTRMERI